MKTAKNANKNLRIAGIIAEFDPLHYGHIRLIRAAREQLQADAVVVVMSGHFTQRGEPAVADPYLRTQAALDAGCDVVFQLPGRYACGSAEFFAHGAVSLLESLGCVTDLIFGSECGSLAALESVADLLCEEPEPYRVALRAALQEGHSYPEARLLALKALLSCEKELAASLNADTLEELLSSPNNTLGIEYLKALRRLDSGICPHTISRIGLSYHEAEGTADLSEFDKTHAPSATRIRSYLLQNRSIASPEVLFNRKLALTHTMPETLARELVSYTETTAQAPLCLDDFSEVLYYALRRAADPAASAEDALESFSDVDEDLAGRIRTLLPQYRTASSFCQLIKTRGYTLTRVRRALLHVMLGHQKKHLSEYTDAPSFVHPDVVYARVLGFRKDHEALLRTFSDHAFIPLILRPGSDADKLSPLAQRLWQEDLFAADLYETCAVSCAQRLGLLSDCDQSVVSRKDTFTRRLLVR